MLKINTERRHCITRPKLGREMWCVRSPVLLRRTDIKPNIKDHRALATLLSMKPPRMVIPRSSQALLAHEDINPNLRNDAGFTPLQLAMQGGAVAAAASDTSFQAQHPELWVSLPEEHRQQLLESSRLSPAELQRARAEIAALLRAHPGIILPDASDVNGDGSCQHLGSREGLECIRSARTVCQKMSTAMVL